jgi:hypothetical protein
VKYSRVFSLAAAVVVVAGSGVWGMSHSSSLADAKPSVVTVDAANTAKAASETTCTLPSKVDGPGAGQKANVSLCASPNGQALRVKFNADCFSAYGAEQIKPCLSNGSWSLYKGEKLVAYARASGSELYPGPGTYTLTASVEVKAVVPNAGFTANGKISHDITLTTPIPPGPRLDGGTNRAGGALTVTVTNVGNKPATNVKINIEATGEAADAMLEQRIAITDDSRCSDKTFGAACKLSSLAPEASASFDLTSAAEELCDRATTIAFAYSYTADGLVPVSGYGPC